MSEAPTLLLDEVEALNSKNKSESAQAILAILNAGHRKGATIPRCDGPTHEVKQFPVYGPKAFAAIGRLPDTLTDRSIVVTMQRRTKGQKVERFLAARAATEAKPIREGVASFASASKGAIGQAYRRLLDMDLEFLTDRDADLWIPLFVICSVSAPHRLAELKKCAIALSAAKAGDDTDDSLPLRLLADIKTVWPEGQERCDTESLIERLKALEESPWAEYQLSARKLAKMLRTDAEGRTHEWAMPMSLLAGDGSEYRARLLDGGLFIAPGRKARELLTVYLQTETPETQLLCVARVGWHEDTFVLPDDTVGPVCAKLLQFVPGSRSCARR